MGMMSDEADNDPLKQMRLPNAERAIVERRKVEEYLLNAAHGQGAAKAAFFIRFGFTAEHWEELAVALANHALRNPATLDAVGRYGEEWVVIGPLDCPDCRRPTVKSIWQRLPHAEAPRLVTAYRYRK